MAMKKKAKEQRTETDSSRAIVRSENILRVRWRESLTYRLAVSYVTLFWIVGIIVMLAFCSIRLKTVYRGYAEFAEKAILRLAGGEEITEQEFPAETIIKITLLADGRTVYRNGDWSGRLPVFRYSLRNAGTGSFFVKYETALFFYGEDCKAVFVFDASEEWSIIRSELLRFVLWYLILSILMVIVCYFSTKAVLRPLGGMTKQVRELNIQNLHNVRLNEEGTEDELKALAAEINRMLGRLDEAYEAQKQFVSEASHELRTPITVLQGYSSMLKRWGAEDKEVLAESIDAIESEAKSMQDLVEKLLFLSRHERRKLPFHKERFEISEIISELEKEMVYMAGDSRIVKAEYEPVNVYGDKQALKQAIRVFLDNAVKYTSEGDTISLRCKKKQGACVIEVEDTGLGMQQKDLEGIFNRFFRSDTVRGKNIEGHGLGLSIARLIVDGHAGKITVRTQYTKGSCFTITLPRQRGA